MWVIKSQIKPELCVVPGLLLQRQIRLKPHTCEGNSQGSSSQEQALEPAGIPSFSSCKGQQLKPPGGLRPHQLWAPVVQDLQQLQQKPWWFNCPSSLAAPWIINGNNILFMPRSSILRQRKQQIKGELFPWREWWIRKIHFYPVPPPWKGILNSCDLLPFPFFFGTEWNTFNIVQQLIAV